MRLLLCIPYFAPAYAFGGSVTVAETVVATTDVLDEHERVAPDAAPPEPPGAEVLRFANVSHRLAAGVNAYAPRGMRRWLAENIGRLASDQAVQQLGVFPRHGRAIPPFQPSRCHRWRGVIEEPPQGSGYRGGVAVSSAACCQPELGK